MSNALKILEYAMEMEKQGENFYEKYKDEVKSEGAKKVFSNLARVEREHYQILKRHYEGLKKNKSWTDLDIELSGGEDIFSQVLEEEKEESMFQLSSSETSDLAIMRMAYLIENDFANFYEKALENAESDQEKNLLKTLANWEHEHRELFYKEFKSLMENNWFDQKFYPF